jgi:hypothetical protein
MFADIKVLVLINIRKKRMVYQTIRAKIKIEFVSNNFGLTKIAR